MPVATTGLLALLRSTTTGRHRALEAMTDMPASVRCVDDLRWRLGQMYGFHRELDPVLRAHPLWCELDLPHCRHGKLAAISADLTALGMDERAQARLPVCTGHPAMTRMAALGVGYVIEGATLGGRIMRRHFARLGDVDAMSGALRHYEGYGQHTGSHWRAFMRAADALVLDERERAQAASAACATFDRLHHWLARDRAEGPAHA